MSTSKISAETAGRGGEASVLALSGGIGGAKLAFGLNRVLAAGELVVVASTGDDFEHLGLHVSPDIDTLTYTLAGLESRDQGWGRRDETWSFVAALRALGGETWFALGDADLAMHVERTRRLTARQTLSQVTDDFTRALGIAARILPMSNDRLRTRLQTDAGWLDFQDYFVRRHCTPRVSQIEFEGVTTAAAHPHLLAMLRAPLRAIVVCPSNPFLSIEPILALLGVREAWAARRAPAIAVSPIIDGRAMKGPTGKMMAELGLPVTSGAAVRRYAGLLDAVLIDAADASEDHGAPVIVAHTLMSSDDDKIGLARQVLATAEEYQKRISA